MVDQDQETVLTRLMRLVGRCTNKCGSTKYENRLPMIATYNNEAADKSDENVLHKAVSVEEHLEAPNTPLLEINNMGSILKRASSINMAEDEAKWQT